MAILISILIFITLLTFLISIVRISGGNGKVTDRLNIYDDKYQENDNIIVEKKKRSWIKSLGNVFRLLSPTKGFLKKYRMLLIKADIPITEEEYFAVKSVFVVALGFLGFAIYKSIIVSIIFGVFFWIFPNIILKMRVNKRMAEFNTQLSDAIVIISNSLKAGYSFLQAVSSVAKETDDPLSKEFKTLFKEMSFGIETDEALKNLVNRVSSENLELMVTSIMIQREVGGNLSEILDNISETIRERQKLKNELKTLTAQGKLSGTIIVLLPIMMGIVLYFMNKSYIMLLFTTTPGLIMTFLGVINQLFGIFVISKIIKVEL